MGIEIDLLQNYPRTKRNLEERVAQKSESARNVARLFGKDFFDGERQYGYGGFSYHPRFWQPTIPDFQKHFDLTGNSSLLDVGCAKGFMLHDLNQLIPGMKLAGLDISSYAIENAIEGMKKNLVIGDARALPFDDDSFDIVISINTVHNLEIDDCIKALKEIERVSRRGAFVTCDAYRNDEEKERMFAWNLTAKTILSVDEWIEVFQSAGYSGDYYWFIP